MYGERPGRVPQVLIVVVLAALALLGPTGRAGASTPANAAATASGAAGWAWPLSEGAPVLLGFGNAYTSGGQTRTHSGCDLAGQTGQDVRAPAEATVTFVGKVPSGDDRRVLAVTLQTADGAKVTFMPLESVRTSAGKGVEAGDPIGTLAAEGDGSSPAAHLHVGLRHGSLYVDPMAYLVPPAAVKAPTEPQPATPAPKPEPVTQPAPAKATPTAVEAPSTVEAPVPTPVRAPSPQPSRAVEPSVRTASQPEARTSTRTDSPRSSAAVSRVPVSAAAPHAMTDVVSTAQAAAGSGPSFVTSLPTLLRALRTRDRLVTTVVSYLLATIAAAGSVAAVVKRARAPIAEVPVAVAAVTEAD